VQWRMSRSALVLALLLLWSPHNPALRVLVIGANGKTGKKVVETALKRDCDVVAVTRGGTLAEPPAYSLSKRLSVVCGDVTSSSSLSKLISKGSADAVVYCASASKEGGSAEQVDCDGVISCAKLCIENKIPSFVIVSSGAVSKPWSPVYLFLNLFGGIMAAKFKGEEKVRSLYSACGDDDLGYTIVRPGGLTEEPPLGVEGLEMNQEDVMSGRVSRWDVAEVCYEAAKSNRRLTFELYNRDTGKPLSSVGFSNLFKLQSEEGVAKGLRSSSYETIFTGLKKDA